MQCNFCDISILLYGCHISTMLMQDQVIKTKLNNATSKKIFYEQLKYIKLFFVEYLHILNKIILLLNKFT